LGERVRVGVRVRVRLAEGLQCIGQQGGFVDGPVTLGLGLEIGFRFGIGLRLGLGLGLGLGFVDSGLLG
jgi:hypothetical protein